MVADAAAAGFKNWGSQKMICVYKHREQKDACHFESFFPEEKKRNNNREYKVQKVMSELLHRCKFLQ
jgi:hypothetical protein